MKPIPTVPRHDRNEDNEALMTRSQIHFTTGMIIYPPEEFEGGYDDAIAFAEKQRELYPARVPGIIFGSCGWMLYALLGCLVTTGRSWPVRRPSSGFGYAAGIGVYWGCPPALDSRHQISQGRRNWRYENGIALR
jgi:hypothetical protein